MWIRLCVVGVLVSLIIVWCLVFRWVWIGLLLVCV